MPKLNNAVIRIIYCSYHVTHHDSDMTFQHNLVSSSEINENPNDTIWLQIETSIILDNNIILDIFNPRKDDKKEDKIIDELISLGFNSQKIREKNLEFLV